MHPLLSPTTHADLKILADQLTASKYCDNSDETYLKLFLGTTLGLTVLESLHGVSVVNNQTVLERGLTERVLKRNSYSVETATTATACTVSLKKAGRLVGSLTADQAEFNPPLAARPLYDHLLAKLVWEYLPDLFGHKFSIKNEVKEAPTVSAPVVAKTVEAVKQHVPGLTTADQIPPVEEKKQRHPHKLELAERSKLLSDWQNRVDGLSSDFPADWDEHALKLKDLDFLPQAEFKANWEGLKVRAREKGLGYNSVTRRFYMLNYTPHVAAV
ncbi:MULTISPECIES: hypothetical protein [unclassified Spirosoma]|uniref:hypothetical protein n=1 Tax=unclassified Spirosoma TaxID=2621999 RepID=UPI000967D342|nr:MULTISPECIES: hypothetical protein [unclassified Spirosoma]MBN8821312.1 hypothetical protein [Spirosoma sp.]OJW78101.1 MAG: hypothetical protein BGO59_29215 [Spirosoma sp. 48-14]